MFAVPGISVPDLWVGTLFMLYVSRAWGFLLQRLLVIHPRAFDDRRYLGELMPHVKFPVRENA